MTRLKSMDVTIGGVTKSYDFGSGIEVSSDDEGEASLEVLRDAETTEVVLSNGISSATVTVDFTYTYSGQVEVELDGLDGEAEDESDVQSIAEGGSDAIYEAIDTEVSENVSCEYIRIDSVFVDQLFDADGAEIDE